MVTVHRSAAVVVVVQVRLATLVRSMALVVQESPHLSLDQALLTPLVARHLTQVGAMALPIVETAVLAAVTHLALMEVAAQVLSY